MSRYMKISVVISTYNGEKYLLPQLNSIKDQTRMPNEVLIFDDHSNDQTVQLINNFIKSNNLTSWKLISNPKNIGWRKNFIEGAWKTTGDLIFTCDQDDIWRKDKLSIMEKIMKENPNINLLASNYQKFFDNGQRKIGPFPNKKELKQIKLRNNYLKVTCPGCTYCIRKKIITLSKKYWQAPYAHDDLFWRLALLDDSLFIYTDYLIYWRKHNDSAYASESRKLKTVEKKYQWINMSIDFNDSIKKYLLEDVKNKTSKKEKILKRNDHWLHLRKKFFETKNILIGIRLLSFIDCYQRLRQYLGDWYLIYVKQK